VDTGVFFVWLHFFNIEILAKLTQKNLAILVKFTLTNKYIPKFSQFLCQKMMKFHQGKKNTGPE
jgi:spore maturation protein CgeB